MFDVKYFPLFPSSPMILRFNKPFFSKYSCHRIDDVLISDMRQNHIVVYLIIDQKIFDVFRLLSFQIDTNCLFLITHISVTSVSCLPHLYHSSNLYNHLNMIIFWPTNSFDNSSLFNLTCGSNVHFTNDHIHFTIFQRKFPPNNPQALIYCTNLWPFQNVLYNLCGLSRRAMLYHSNSCKSNPPNLSFRKITHVDIYHFSFVLWSISSLTPIFNRYCHSTFYDAVKQCNVRMFSVISFLHLAPITHHVIILPI